MADTFETFNGQLKYCDTVEGTSLRLRPHQSVQVFDEKWEAEWARGLLESNTPATGIIKVYEDAMLKKWVVAQYFETLEVVR